MPSPYIFMAKNRSLTDKVIGGLQSYENFLRFLSGSSGNSRYAIYSPNCSHPDYFSGGGLEDMDCLIT